MLRSVSHRFALVNRYLIDRFAFPFGTRWVALYRISFTLSTRLCFPLAFACECSAFPCYDGLTVHVSALLVNPFYAFLLCRLQHCRALTFQTRRQVTDCPYQNLTRIRFVSSCPSAWIEL